MRTTEHLSHTPARPRDKTRPSKFSTIPDAQ
jgi:hypothetical protein